MRIIVCLLLLFPGLVMAQFAGNALHFDGSDDLALIPYQSGLSFDSGASATFEMWLQPTGDQTTWHAIGMRDSCGSAMNYQIARDITHLLHFNTTGCLLSSETLIPVGEWSHIAVTASGSKLRFYINAELVSEANCGLGISPAAPLIIGGSGTCSQKFPGLIDEVRIWNTDRSAAELLANADCPINGTPASLVGYWKFDEAGSSQAILDSSASGFNGSLGGTLDPASDDPTRVSSTAPLDCAAFKDGFEAMDQPLSHSQ